MEIVILFVFLFRSKLWLPPPILVFSTLGVLSPSWLPISPQLSQCHEKREIQSEGRPITALLLNTRLPDPSGLNAGSADPRFRSGSGSGSAQKRPGSATSTVLQVEDTVPSKVKRIRKFETYLTDWRRIPRQTTPQSRGSKQT
jgi:hypothetical protein